MGRAVIVSQMQVRKGEGMGKVPVSRASPEYRWHQHYAL